MSDHPLQGQNVVDANADNWDAVIDALSVITDTTARHAVALLLVQMENSLDDVQLRDLRRASPGDDSALQEAYIGVEDAASALHAAWFGDDPGNEGGASTSERLVARVFSQTATH